MSKIYILSISQMSTQIANWALQAACKSLEECLHFQHCFYGLTLLLIKSCCLHLWEKSEVAQLLGIRELNSWSSACNIWWCWLWWSSQRDSCLIYEWHRSPYYSYFVHLIILPVLEPSGKGYRGQWCIRCALHCPAMAWHGKNNPRRSPAICWCLFQSLPR